MAAAEPLETMPQTIPGALSRWMVDVEVALATLVERMTPGFHQDHAKRLLGDLREERQRLLGESTPAPELVGWQPVASSNIAMVRYDQRNESLFVRFSSGQVYQYLGVPRACYMDLMSASSPGSFLAKRIKGVYPYAKLDPEDVEVSG